jgi:hypothetical protein
MCLPLVLECIWHWLFGLLGERAAKYKEKVLRYTKTIIFWVKCLEVVAKCCLNRMFILAAPSIVVLGTQT